MAGSRHTAQRQAIQSVLENAEGPLSRAEIFRKAQRLKAGLGQATVYRTLKLLEEQGKVRSVWLERSEVRYESADLGHHHHFRCRLCHRVFDLQAAPQACQLPGNQLLAEAGFLVESHQVTLTGLCPLCCSGRS